ncbi:hypothetical protein TWF718_006361 [Orbilia javanica]|uniref:F-box domain-containing protein n=1 Tax=Orbilia javanica TaxID=47235 RepID=A0AAN8MR26_9PEZI
MFLLSLPQELVDMILAEGLTVSDLGKVRLISKDYNTKFKDDFYYQVFKEIRINLRSEHIEKLAAIAAGSPGALPYMQHIIISPIWDRPYRQRYNDEDFRNPQLGPLLAKMFSTLTHLKTIEFDVSSGTQAIGYWKPIIDAVIAGERTTVETIKGPKAAIQMSKFKPLATAKLLKDYRATFCNLKSLEIQTSVQSETPAATAHFWSMINAMGAKLEDLTVENSRMSFRDDPSPGRQRSYQPKGFDLPQLKRLKLVDVAITATDLKALLSNSDGIEIVDIAACRMPKEKNDWFEVLGHLKKHRFPKLQELSLKMSACFNQTAYDLPRLEVKGDWTVEDCFVTLRSATIGDYVNYVFKKNLWNELDLHQTVDEFWDSLTDRKWRSKGTTRWKRRRLIESKWTLEMRQFGNPDYLDDTDPDVQWVNAKYLHQITELNAEVDEDDDE